MTSLFTHKNSARMRHSHWRSYIRANEGDGHKTRQIVLRRQNAAFRGTGIVLAVLEACQATLIGGGILARRRL